MPTSPERVRSGLLKITKAARRDLRTVATAAGEDPQQVRAALFAATPLLVADYGDYAGLLAADWFEELREAAAPSSPFAPRPVQLLTDDDIAAAVAATTKMLREAAEDVERQVAEAIAAMEDELAREVAASFNDTMLVNAHEDPASVGWRRFARPEACKFCKMLADRGAVYTAETARFAAHGAVMRGERKGGNCMCIAGPAFGGKEIWGEATPMQYVASKRERTDEERAALREYLNENFPDAPG